MAFIVWSQMEEAVVSTILSATTLTPALPVADGAHSFGLGLAATVGGVWAGGNAPSISLKTRNVGTNISTQIAEIGQVGSVNNGGYGRIPIGRGNGTVSQSGGWPAATNAGASDNFSSTPPQKTFSFSGSGPNLGGGSGSAGATLWMVCKSTTAWTNTSTPNNDLLFGADLAAVRNFGNGDTENVVCAYKQS